MHAIWTLLVRARTAGLLVGGATLMISAALLIVGRGYPTPAPNATIIHAANSSPSVAVSSPGPTPTAVRGTHRPEPPRRAHSAPVVIQVVGPSLPVEQLGPPAPAAATVAQPAPPPPPASSSDTPAPASTDSAAPRSPAPTTPESTPSPTDG